jgi:hypothetical protein
MSDVIDMIRRDIQDDASIKSHDILLETKAKGLVRRRKFIRIHGATDSQLAKDKVTRIAEHHAGDNFDIVNELIVKE